MAEMPRRETVRATLRLLLAAGFVFAGSLHFTKTTGYVGVMPAYLPHPRALVLISGFFEILGGVGVLLPQPFRRLAGWGLIALLIAVFPANIEIALHGATLGQTHVEPLWGWLRLPLQIPLMYWAWFATAAPTQPRD
jgi:uncharacterized membrane protein